MVDKDNEEYEFVDPDVISPDALGGENLSETEKTPLPSRAPGQKNVIRNAVIVLVVVFLAMLIYKFTMMFLSRKPAVKSAVPVVTVTQPKPAPVETPPVKEEVPSAANEALTEAHLLKQKIAEMELSQQDVRDDVTRMNEQVNNATTAMSDLTAKMSKLSETIDTLSQAVAQQSKQIEHFQTMQILHKKPKKVIRIEAAPRLQYFIQAIIPGRAWLMASNGSTLTVRVGTRIYGYGVVTHIDAKVGLVRMSDGHVFKFSQDDS